MCYKILNAIITIDRDAYAIDDLYKTIANTDILIVCRISDKETIKKWSKYNVLIKAVPHYDIIDRHNFDMITLKRNIAREYAINNNYDYLFFIDSDILINKNTLEILLNANCDICIIPYEVKWLGYTAVGIFSDKFEIKKIEYNDNKVTYEDCVIGGFGCTLLNKEAMKIEIKFNALENNKYIIYGEDIGYFMEAFNKKLNIKYVTNHKILHL
jgi:hypothetical protein